MVKIVCKKELCPAPKECPQYHLLKKQQLENSCCPLCTCEPPKDKCIFETEYAAAELGGEKRLTKLEVQKLLKKANETWNDGPCRQCKCTITSIGKEMNYTQTIYWLILQWAEFFFSELYYSNNFFHMIGESVVSITLNLRDISGYALAAILENTFVHISS